MVLSTLAFMSGVSNAAVTLAGLPSRAMAKRILETSLHGVPGHTEVNPATVAAHFAQISVAPISAKSSVAQCFSTAKPPRPI